jgi:lipopolysaccharide biosynthesis glycosyltransferase
MTAECAICYVSDVNFLLPSIVSAIQIRKYVPKHKASIYIFLIDNPERISDLNEHLQSYSIQVIAMSSSSYSNFDIDKFHQTGIPTSSLGRFAIEELLPERCKRIVYLDGDTWIARDPSALIDAVVPEGRFAAAEDIMSLRRSPFTSHGRFIRSYYQNIGINWEKNGYFNAGVFAVERKTWRTLSQEGFLFFKTYTEHCRFHDQSALNAVVGDRRLQLSTRWNFQTSYRFLNVEQSIQPCIYHLTQSPKPWMGAFSVWKELYPQYQNEFKAFSKLNLPVKTISDSIIQEHNRLNLSKKILLNSPLAARLMSLFLGYEKMEKKSWL